MRRVSDRQAGFSVIEVVLVVAVIGVVGVAGWFVYQHNRPKVTDAASGNQTTNQNGNQQSNTNSSSNQNSAANMFAIPELNAKLTLPDGLAATDLKYSVSTLDGYPAAGFTTTTLEQADGTGSCSASQASIGVIWRTTQNVASGSVTVKQIGQYYYAFQKAQGSCANNVNAGKLELSQIGLLQQAFQTITSIN